jgi:hypothetical protein
MELDMLEVGHHIPGRDIDMLLCPESSSPVELVLNDIR